MPREKRPRIEELSRTENKGFNDLRDKVGVEGVRDKDIRAIERWMKTHRA